MSYRERTKNANGTYSENTHITGSDIMQPVEIQGRYAQTIQTHNAVSIGASASSTQSTWIDCNGYDQIAVTLSNDGTTASTLNVTWSNDGVTAHGAEAILPNATGSAQRTGIVPVKARYAKLVLINGDAAAHTMSAWAYLKA
jgi:hypothetical protein